MGVFYTTRERVKAALDAEETSRADARIDDVIESSSRTIDGSKPGDGLLHRRFYPELRTMTWDWPPAPRSGTSWRLWLDANELISITSMTAGGIVVPQADRLLRPDHGPPFTHLELDRSGTSVFAAGDTTQRAISITGVYGFNAESTVAGILAEGLDASETGIDVSDSAAIGVGSIIKVDDERMIVTGKSQLDTGQNIGGNLTASHSNVTVPVTTGSAYAVDEVILVDSERMRILDIAGNNLTVKRAYDGTVLVAHTSGADIYAPRTLTVTRGALGTTAATHSTSAAITRHVVPGTVAELALAEAMNELLQGRSGYSRMSGTGENARESSGRGLAVLRKQAVTAYGRKGRSRAI